MLTYYYISYANNVYIYNLYEINLYKHFSLKVLLLLILEMCKNATHGNHFACCRHVYLTRMILYSTHVPQTTDDFNTVGGSKHVELYLGLLAYH